MHINAAEGGHPDAQWRLAIAYEKGELNLAIDDEEALNWYRQAAEVGHGWAKFCLGVAYEEVELGVEIDLAAARAFYQEAAQGGDGYAQCRLAEACEGGVDDKGVWGLDYNEEEALKWYQKVAVT